MAIEFRSINEEDETERELAFCSVGLLKFTKDNNWFAHKCSTGFSASGNGAPTPIEHGLWVTSLTYEKVRAIGTGLGQVHVRSESWMKLPIAQLEAAFGLETKAPPAAAQIGAQILQRVYRLAQEALRGSMIDMGYKTPMEFKNILERSSSLATAIATVNEKALARSSSSERRVVDHFNKTYQSGMYHGRKTDAADGQIDLSFHFPRLSYALRVASEPVPASTAWQVASRDDGRSVGDFINDIRELGRPAIFKAMCQVGEGYVPDYVQAYANSLHSGMGDAMRARYLLKELDHLTPFYKMDVEGVVVGGATRVAATHKLLQALVYAAGGEDAAHCSWSVGIAAENILASAFRAPRKETPGSNAEAVWLAARDRAEMLPAIEVLCGMGATFVRAATGMITVRCPLDIELLTLVVNAAWEHGLVLPLETIEDVRQQGVMIPADQNLWGGSALDYPLAAAIHKRQRNALWLFDSIMDQPATHRAREHKLLMSN